MKKVLLFLGLLAAVFINTKAATVKYAAPIAIGNGTGSSIDNATDFLNSNFWLNVQKILNREPVTVKFLAGNYVRAYTEKAFTLSNMGNTKNLLILEGDSLKTLFTVPTDYLKKDVLIDIQNTQNMMIRNFCFTGNGNLGYALKITSGSGYTTKNIWIENCNWTDMKGIIFGATGAHHKGTSNIIYSNCIFKRVGFDSHSHFIYNAYNASNISVLNCYFEDCTGDYVRFRDNCDYATVKGSTFVRNDDFPIFPFISIPVFNDVNPGDETFGTHYIFIGNNFKNDKYAIVFHHYGFDPIGYNYLLTEAEGSILASGTPEQKKKLLQHNLGINLNYVKVSDNVYSGIASKMAIGSFPRYGAVTAGWSGWADISTLVN
jgi:hypothetical protein